MVHILGGKNNMKTATKISLIATISTLALAGTAFAAWEFNESANANANSNVAITADTSVGTLVVNPSAIYLTLDQDLANPVFTSVNYNNSENAVANADIITSLELTYTGSAKSNDVSDVTLSVVLTVDPAIATYVTVSGGDTVPAGTNNANVKTSTYTLPTLAWASGKKPTTQAQYDAMIENLNGKQITFAFSATVGE